MRRTRSRRSPTPFIVAGGLIAIVVVAVLAVTLLSGGDDDPEPPADALGPAPTLDGNVIAIYPEHGAEVEQATTRTGTQEFPGAVCVRVRFGDTTNGTSYRMAVDGVEVTEETIWYGIDPAKPELPEEAQLCYDPPEGLDRGRIDAAVSVQDPNSAGPPQEVVAWKFDVQ
jgi:hypothetical protein